MTTTEKGLFGHVYDDVVPQLTARRRQGVARGVYSSGLVEAQQLLFGHSVKSDLRWLFSHYFDTRRGAKRQRAVHQAIAAELALLPVTILFLSDIYQEVDAAYEAGWGTCQLFRDDHCASGSYPQARRFDAIIPRSLFNKHIDRLFRYQCFGAALAKP